jgi:hypothetical protein
MEQEPFTLRIWVITKGLSKMVKSIRINKGFFSYINKKEKWINFLHFLSYFGSKDWPGLPHWIAATLWTYWMQLCH